jgi:hypothetical protein
MCAIKAVAKLSECAGLSVALMLRFGCGIMKVKVDFSGLNKKKVDLLSTLFPYVLFKEIFFSRKKY